MDAGRFSGVTRVYLDGEFLAPEAARVSAFDRGFLFGDGLYEVIPVYKGRPFALAAHLDRLNRNLALMEIPAPMADADWQSLIGQLLEHTDQDRYIYLQVTRGAAPRDHAYPPQVTPTVFAYANTLSAVPAATLESGVAAITLQDIRWLRCDIKTTSLLGHVWLRQQAAARGAAEALLVRDGLVMEGAATNVFAVINGVARTAPLGPELLPGITRQVVIDLLRRNAVAVAEEAFTPGEMRAAEEVWITSSTKEILPVTRIDGESIAAGRSGPLFRRAHALFQEIKDSPQLAAGA